MEQLGTGAGLAALGFWIFIGVIIIAGVWDNIRKRDAQHETLRRMIDSGEPIDHTLADKLLSVTSANKDLPQDLRVGGYIMFGLVPGLIALGAILSLLASEVFTVLLAVSALVGFIGAGLLYAARMVEKQQQQQSL